MERHSKALVIVWGVLFWGPIEEGTGYWVGGSLVDRFELHNLSSPANDLPHDASDLIMYNHLCIGIRF